MATQDYLVPTGSTKNVLQLPSQDLDDPEHADTTAEDSVASLGV